MIRITNLKLKIDEKLILKNINLEVNEGECMALLGPNGAGKSSLIDVMTGALLPTAGNVTVLGNTFKKIKRQVGVLYEYTPLFSYAKVRELLSYICVIYGVSPKDLNELKKNLGIDNIENRLIKVLSKGERRKVGILLSTLHNPQLLILDEPTSGMDPFVRESCWKLFKQNRRTILFSTHLWEEADKYADRIAFISNGEIIKVDTPQSFLSDTYLKARNRVTIPCSKKFLLLLQDNFYIEENGSYYVYPVQADEFIAKIKGKIKDYSVTSVTLNDVFLYLTKRGEHV